MRKQGAEEKGQGPRACTQLLPVALSFFPSLYTNTETNVSKTALLSVIGND